MMCCEQIQLSRDTTISEQVLSVKKGRGDNQEGQPVSFTALANKQLGFG
mgnify:CR=1 FL=1